MSKDKQVVDVKQVVRQTVRTLAEGGAESEKGLDDWRSLWQEMDDAGRFDLTQELLGMAVGQRQIVGSPEPILFAPEFLGVLQVKVLEYLLAHLRANGEEVEARLLESIVTLYVYQIGKDDDGQVRYLNNQMAAEAIGEISQLFYGWEI